MTEYRIMSQMNHDGDIIYYPQYKDGYKWGYCRGYDIKEFYNLSEAVTYLDIIKAANDYGEKIHKYPQD